MTTKLSAAQWEALGWAASATGGWPRAAASERSWAIRSYRALERRNLVGEFGSKDVRGGRRVNFRATEAGSELWRSHDGAEAGGGQ